MKTWAATGFSPWARQTTRSLSTSPRPSSGNQNRMMSTDVFRGR